MREGSAVAGCSAWDNREILGEVVMGLPRRLRLLGGMLRMPPLRWARLPHVPRRGEALRSWYLYDAHATRPDLGVALIRHVAAAARKQGIDYLYLTHTAGQGWVEAVRADYPRAFAPVIRYVMVGGWSRPEPLGRLDRLYVDIRDL